MQFDRLRLRGFKSFSDEVELPIADGLTGIVGPNGCGKSNVVEAIRWVMGESSARDLRGTEMDDVLFGGSALRPAFDIAEVALSLVSPEPEPVEGTQNVYGLAEARAQKWGGELEVKRRLERGGGSTYRINNREVRARDVQLVFADAAAGSRSPAIISQGRVTSIVEAKPEDRRRLLEDAAGIGGLHSRRREAELKLNATEANLARVRDRLADLEQDLSSLQRQAREAERYRKLTEEIRYFDQLLMLARIVDAETRTERSERKLQSARTEVELSAEALASIVGELAGIANEMPGLQTEVTRLTASLAAGKERLSRLSHDADRLARERARLETGIAETRKESDGVARELIEKLEARPLLQEELAQARRQSTELEQKLPGMEAELVEFRQREVQARQALQSSFATLATQKAELAETDRRLENLEKRRHAIQAELARAAEIDDEALVKVAERELNEARLRLEDANTEHANAEKAKDASLSTFEESRSRLEVCRKAAEEAAGAWQELENERLKVQTLRDAYVQKSDDLVRRRERLQAELVRLEKDLVDCDPQPLAASKREIFRKRGQLEEELASARDRLREVSGEREAVRSRSEAQKNELLAARDALRTLETEAQALEVLREDGDPKPVLNGLIIDDGYQAALAAALGDDLLSGATKERPRFWREIEAGMLPAWAEPVETLDKFVRGEPVLAARLATVGVCSDADSAFAMQTLLKPGQRLVTKAGGLWRWDGFVQNEGAARASDERLRHQRRTNELARSLPRLRDELEHKEADYAACEAAEAAAALMLEEAKRSCNSLDKRLDEAVREAALHEERSADLENRYARLTNERARVEAELEQAEQELGALTGPSESRVHFDQELALALQAKTTRAEALEDAKEQFRLDETEHRRAVSKQDAIGRTVEDARMAFVRAENLFERRRGEAEGRRQSREQSISSLSVELEELVTESQSQGCHRTALAEAVESGTVQQSEMKTCLAEIENRTLTLAEELTSARGQMRILLERVEVRTKGLETLDGEIEALRQREQQLAGRLDELLVEAEAHKESVENEGELAGDIETLGHRIATDERNLENLKGRLAELQSAHAMAAQRKDEASDAAITAREKLASVTSEHEQAEIALANAVGAARRGISEPPEKLLDNPQIREALSQSSVRQVEGQLEALKAKRERMGAVNLRAAAEIEERQAAFVVQRDEEAELTSAIERLSNAIGELDREAKKRLTAAFDQVDSHFRKLFTKLFGGGKAHLRLTNIDIPGKAGLELDAMPPGKKLQNISLLSGGEKGLTALALVFALFLSQPSPLCVLDEVDAALDDANVERFIELMIEIARSTGTRFIVVTHHPLTMARMDRLFGVTMIERGVSRLVSVSLSTAVEMRSTA